MYICIYIYTYIIKYNNPQHPRHTRQWTDPMFDSALPFYFHHEISTWYDLQPLRYILSRRTVWVGTRRPTQVISLLCLVLSSTVCFVLMLGSGKKLRHCRAPNSKVGLGPWGEDNCLGQWKGSWWMSNNRLDTAERIRVGRDKWSSWKPCWGTIMNYHHYIFWFHWDVCKPFLSVLWC